METAAQVLTFWFDEIEPKQWWKKDPAFDQLIAARFGTLHAHAVAGGCQAWLSAADTSLALVLVLDQFSRNIFRDQPRAFAADAQALAVASAAIDSGFDKQLSNTHKQFLYMPFMHSESAAVHARALVLFESLDGDDSAEFERRHKAIIDRFGRYPHRNKILGRASTPEEIAFLQQPGSSF